MAREMNFPEHIESGHSWTAVFHPALDSLRAYNFVSVSGPSRVEGRLVILSLIGAGIQAI